jgi:hypothetical protein
VLVTPRILPIYGGILTGDIGKGHDGLTIAASTRTPPLYNPQRYPSTGVIKVKLYRALVSLGLASDILIV